MSSDLASYAQIGKSELIQAIGIMNDTGEFAGIELTVKDGQSETTVTNKNNIEKEYGDKERLSTTPLLLWMYFHYLSPDAEGLVRNISIREAADYLNVSVKGIRKAIEALVKSGYIFASEIINSTVTIMLPDFKNYFKTKDQGGHGYLELSEDNFLSLVSIANQRLKRGTKDPDDEYKNKSLVNRIRIKIRSFIMCDHAQRQYKRNKKADKTVTKTLHEMLSFLPGYFYPKKLLKVLDSIKDTIAYVVEDDKVKMVATVGDFNGVKERNSLIRTIGKNVKNKINEINDLIQQYNLSDAKDPYILTAANIYLQDDLDCCKTYSYSKEEVNDIAKLCLQYSEDVVFEALGYIYSNFIITGRTIQNFGALLRTCIRSYAI